MTENRKAELTEEVLDIIMNLSKKQGGASGIEAMEHVLKTIKLADNEETFFAGFVTGLVLNQFKKLGDMEILN